jgi:hypothetical protein
MSAGIQFRRPKATMQTAHSFHREGSFCTGSEHQMSDEERNEHWDAETDQLFGWAKANFPRGRNLEYAILKGHLILERALGFYIRSHSYVLVDDDDLKFSFRQKIDIAYLMGFGVNDPTVIPTIERWNLVRNKVAHSFELDRSQVDEMIRVNSENYSGFELSNDQQRVTLLRNLCFFICAKVAGESDSHRFFDIARANAYRASIGI